MTLIPKNVRGKLTFFYRMDQMTVLCMVFAKDKEDPSKSLTCDEIMDNALFLILAGSETSASAFTNAILLLGESRSMEEVGGGAAPGTG